MILTGMIVITFLAALGSVPVSAQDGYTPEFEWAECPFPLPPSEVPQSTIDCGYLIVPQNRADPQGQQVELAVAILYSTSANPAPDPLVYLEGGPGGSALTGVDAWYSSPLRADRDIVIFDQRGTGYSIPRLHCWEMDDLDPADLDTFIGDAALSVGEQKALQDCRARLVSEGVDLVMYNSAASADDIVDLRTALEYDAVNLFGVSYGTRLALTVMRDHPAGVRSVVLDSSYPPNVDAYELGASNTYRVFRQLFDDCAAEPSCSAAYPDLEARFVQLVNAWNADPQYIPDLDQDVLGDDVIGMVFQMFYNTAAIPYLPLMLDDLTRGDTELFVLMVDGEVPDAGDLGGEAGESYADDDLVALFVDEFFWLTEAFSDAQFNAMYDELDGWDLQDWSYFSAVIDAYFEPEDADYLLGLLDEMTLEEQQVVIDVLIWGDEYDLGPVAGDENAAGGDEDYLDDADYEQMAALSDTVGMFDAVECYEELPFNLVADAEAIAQSVPPPYAGSDQALFAVQRETCAIWQSGTADAIETQAVTSAIPTLVLAGEYDPVTPPEWGRIAAQSLSNGYYFEYPAVGHGVIDGGPCPEVMIAAFLNQPQSAPDSACIAAMTGPAFVLP